MFKKIHKTVPIVLSLILMAGCSDTSVPAGDKGSEPQTEAAAIESDAVKGQGTEVSENTSNVSDNPLAYSPEERWRQSKLSDGGIDKDCGIPTTMLPDETNPSNKFIMIDEVITELPEDHPLYGTEEAETTMYVAIKGTLYELFYEDNPCLDRVYFPGDALPEGYTVKTTENVTIPICTISEEMMSSPGFDGAENVTRAEIEKTLAKKYVGSHAYIVEEDLWKRLVYKFHRDGYSHDYEKDNTIDYLGSSPVKSCVELLIKPGMYGSISISRPYAKYDKHDWKLDEEYGSPDIEYRYACSTGVEFVQYLLEDQLPEEGSKTKIDKAVVHY